MDCGVARWQLRHCRMRQGDSQTLNLQRWQCCRWWTRFHHVRYSLRQSETVHVSLTGGSVLAAFNRRYSLSQLKHLICAAARLIHPKGCALVRETGLSVGFVQEKKTLVGVFFFFFILFPPKNSLIPPIVRSHLLKIQSGKPRPDILINTQPHSINGNSQVFTSFIVLRWFLAVGFQESYSF